jgi:signal transduction histidine kinase
MRDRASGAGGTLTVESVPGKGTVIEMEVPGG